MDEWVKFLETINSTISEFEADGCDFPVFRGQGKSEWDLEPSLFRYKNKSNIDFERLESTLYFDFVTYSAKFVTFRNSWDCLFEMRHRGLPTRLLDWSENFATALYFALQENLDSPTIWVLNPYRLNEITLNEAILINPIAGLDFTYEDAYLDLDKIKDTTSTGIDYTLQLIERKKGKPYNDSIAIVPPLSSERLFAQKGLFTLQGLDETPINKKEDFKDCIKKIDLPSQLIGHAKKFLELAGVNEFSIYPDLDGLARHLANKNSLIIPKRQNNA